MSPRSVPPALLASAHPWRRWLSGALAALLVVGAASWARAAAGAASPGWSSTVLDTARTLPLQDGGRVKPLDTYAGHTLLRLNHKRSSADGQDGRLDAVGWLLDVIARPEQARTYPCFKVDNDEVLAAVGLEVAGKKKSDRYSFVELAPVRNALRALARQHAQAKESSKDRSPVENGVIELSSSMELFDALTRFLDFARPGLALPSSPGLRALWPGRDRVSPLEVLERAGDVRALVGDAPHGQQAPAPAPGSDAAGALALLDGVIEALNAAQVLALLPPAGDPKQAAEWLTPGEVLIHGAQGEPTPEAHAAMVQSLAALAQAGPDAAAFEGALRSLHEQSVALATRRGEYDKVPLEVRLTRMDPFYRSVYLYVLAFLVLAVSWAWPNRWLTRGAWALLLAATALHVTGVTMRCILRERPPVLNLYDTTLFISWVGAALCLVAERIHRRGIGLALAPIFGGLGLFVANSFEALEGKDTMQPLVAVLDTNFWLATHVTCITIGYGGGLLASLVAHVHVLGRTFGVKRDDPGFYALLTRLTYGMLGFALVFSVVGTILGGIWANESWGRFWGWDPKENGALMICLSQLAILHARLGGLLKPFGVALATIGSGMIVAFSWWGVNLLGIGLHSYGFTGGIWTGLMTFYLVEAVVLGLGVTAMLSGRAYPRSVA